MEMLRPKNLNPMTILISTSLHPKTRPNFHAKHCQLFRMDPHRYGCRNNAHRNGRKKSRTGNMVDRQEAGPILPPRFECGSQSPELRHTTRVAFIYFLLQRCWLFLGTELSRLGSCKAQSPAPSLRAC